MVKKIRARYSDGVLTPLGMRDLAEGTEVMLHIDSETNDESAFRVVPNRSGFVDGIDESRLNTQELLHGGQEQDAARLSAREWLEEVRKHKEASPTRVTSSQILEARDADRR